MGLLFLNRKDAKAQRSVNEIFLALRAFMSYKNHE